MSRRSRNEKNKRERIAKAKRAGQFERRMYASKLRAFDADMTREESEQIARERFDG